MKAFPSILPLRFQWPIKSLLYIIPGIIVIWAIYINIHQGPFNLRSIDPEYVYLINGLNCATLDFHKIGHIDHPGTPHQLLLGLFFRIIHLFTGYNDITTDVISSPELYLSLSSILLTFITFFVLLRLGILVYRYTSSILGALVIQSAYLYTEIHYGILSRFNPDRLITVIILLFFLLYLRHLYDKKFSILKFAILSGIVMGLGLTTKYNFIPLLVLPFILIPGWKNRAYYILSCLGSSFIFVLPVLSKLKTLWQTITGWILHTGLYGTGDQGIIDATSFSKNLLLIFKNNPSFTIITVLGCIILLLLLIKPNLRSKNINEFLFLTASFISILLGLVITAKHYKGYYALPILSLIPMIFFTIIRISENSIRFKFQTFSYTILFIILLLFPVISTAKDFTGTNEDLQDKRITEAFILDNITSENYLIITPTWMSSPMPGSALAFGVSWLARRELSYLDYERVYPNTLTWEGTEKPLSHMRMRKANLEEALLSGKGIYLYSKPGWNGSEICNYIELFARNAGIGVKRDTIYSYAAIKEYIVRYRNADGWERTEDLICGFEKSYQDQVYSDDEQMILMGANMIKEGIYANGNFSSVLGKEIHQSPVFSLNGINSGDVVSSSVKINITNGNDLNNLRIKCEYTDINGETVTLYSDPDPGQIDEEWYLINLYAGIESQPADSSIRCFVEYNGDGAVHLDDFTLKIYSQVTRQITR